MSLIKPLRYIPEIHLQIVWVYNLVNYAEPYYQDYVYPKTAVAFGWLIAVSSFFPVVYFIIKEIISQDGSFKEVCIFIFIYIFLLRILSNIFQKVFYFIINSIKWNITIRTIDTIAFALSSFCLKFRFME